MSGWGLALGYSDADYKLDNDDTTPLLRFVEGAYAPKPGNDAWDWMDEAACSAQPDLSGANCKYTDPESFFDGRSPDTALRVCGGCPVRQKCLDWARLNEETIGIWGGVDMASGRTVEDVMSESVTPVSEVKGVSWSRRHRRWEAKIQVNGVRTHLGYFENLDDAEAAAKGARAA